MNGKKPFFCAVIPMFNEEAGAVRCVEAVSRALHGLDEDSRLIVVQDGSQDRTGLILESLAKKWDRLFVVTHKKNMGYGKALVTGTRAAENLGAEYILFMDSDLTNDPVDIPKFVAEMKKGTDVIKATRYSLGGGVKGVPWFRYVISKYGNLLARFLLQIPLSDPTNGFRAIRTNLLKGIVFKENAFPIIMEELYKLSSVETSFYQIPVFLSCRSSNLRKTSFHYSPKLFCYYLRYPLRKFFDRLFKFRPV